MFTQAAITVIASLLLHCCELTLNPYWTLSFWPSIFIGPYHLADLQGCLLRTPIAIFHSAWSVGIFLRQNQGSENLMLDFTSSLLNFDLGLKHRINEFTLTNITVFPNLENKAIYSIHNCTMSFFLPGAGCENGTGHLFPSILDSNC